MGRAHLDRATTAGQVVEEDLQKHFARFETIVSARIGSFFDVGDELSRVFDAANTRRAIIHAETKPALGAR